ncbi:MAG: MaoC family dehydratase [Dehalococcoidia bacterium]
MEATRTWADIEVGQEFPPITYRVSPEAVRDFESVTGVEHPWHSGGSPYGGAIVPATLPCTDYGLFLSQILPPIVGMHANHRLRLIRPIPVDSDVRVSCRVTDKYQKRNHKYLTMEYTIDDGNGNAYMVNTITMTVDAYILASGVQREQIDE